MTESLNRREVEAIAACVAACNDGGVHDPLLAKLRALWVSIPPQGCRAFGPHREPGAPDTVVMDPTAPVDTNDVAALEREEIEAERRAAGGERVVSPERATSRGPEVPPYAPVSPPASRGPQLRPETLARIARKDHPLAKDEEIDPRPPRRQRRTRPMPGDER